MIYSPEETQLITQLRESGASVHEIAEVIKAKYDTDRTPTGIRRHCERNHITKNNHTEFERVVFANDFHIPFHDSALVELFLRFLAYFKPHRLFLLGDLLDCYSLSKFSKEPGRIASLQSELRQSHYYLNRMAKMVPQIEFFEGNHEHRLHKALVADPKLYGLDCLTWPELLHLKEFDIPFYSYDAPPVRFRKLYLHHGLAIRKHSGWTAKAHYERFGGCGIVGHSHRGGEHVTRNMHGFDAWYENFCMCRLDPEYDAFPDWCQGWSVAYFTKKGLFHLEQIPVIDGEFLFNGRLFTV